MNLLKKWLRTILNLFKNKNHHGFRKYCLSGKCQTCNTPWPVNELSILDKYLKSINYYERYIKIVRDNHILNLPKGVDGQELINIANKLKPEYHILTKGKGEEEVRKRGAQEGYDKE